MYVGRYRNRNGNRYIKVKETTAERINIHTLESEKPENIRTQEESKKQNEIKQEIYQIIDDYIYFGRSTLELIEILNSEERFKNYGQYFAGWIEDRNSKYQIVLKTIENERKQGKSNEEIFKKLSFNHKLRVHRKYIKELLSNEKDESEKGIEHE